MANQNNRLILKLSDYQSSYTDNLQSFLNKSEDHRESDYITSQLEYFEMADPYRSLSFEAQDYLKKYHPECTVIDIQHNRKIFYRRVVEFLKKRLSDIEIEKQNETNAYTPNQKEVPNPNIKFNISQTELIELIKALIENGTVKGKQKDIVNSFSQFFDIEINYPDKLITDIKNRKNGSETLFLDKLKSTLFNYITTEKKR